MSSQPDTPEHTQWAPPKLTPEQRRDAARGWLTRCHQTPTPDRIAELTPYVGVYRPGTEKARVADSLIRAGEMPRAAAVNARASRRPRKPYIQEQLSPEEIESVIEWIDAYRSERGEGPLWREVRTQFGWSIKRTEILLWWLRRQRRVWFTNQPRSLKRREPTSGYRSGSSESLRRER